MKLSSRQIGKMWRAFERNALIGFSAEIAGPLVVVGGIAAYVWSALPDAPSGCFNNAADDNALYLTYEGSEPKKAPDSWTMAADGKTCETLNPFATMFGGDKSVPVTKAPTP